MKNVALGLLGHVDVGKTSIIRQLTSVHGTAAMDKHPQSQERGITIDLGFSAMVFDDIDLRVTLVDCPGHLSLLRTMISCAHLVDMLLLVVDVTIGIQQQTLDCVVLAELSTATCEDVIIVLNKLDLIPVDQRLEQIEKVKHTLRNQLSGTLFESCPMISVIAAATTKSGFFFDDGIFTLCESIEKMALSCKCVRDIRGPFYMSVDHCFSISGQGTILTGTVLRGSIIVGDMVELPLKGLKKVVKSIQAFRKPQTWAEAGDRVGLCITGLNPKAMERGIVTLPGSIQLVSSVIAVVRGTLFYEDKCKSGGLYNIQIGHVNVPARFEFFGAKELQTTPELLKCQEQNRRSGGVRIRSLLPELKVDWDQDFEAQNDLMEINDVEQKEGEEQQLLRTLQFAVVKFKQPTYVPYPPTGIAISPKYAKGTGIPGCHLAFYLRLLEPCTESRNPRIYKLYERKGFVVRPSGDKVILSGGNQGWTEAVCGGMFKKETILTPFIGMIVETETGELGRITGAFGQTGKVRVQFPIGAELFEGKCIKLCFRRYKYDKTMSMNQDDRREAIAKLDCQHEKLLPKQQELPQAPNLVMAAAASNNTQSSHTFNAQQTHQDVALRTPQIRNGWIVSIQDVKGSQGPQTNTVCIIDGFFEAEEDIKLYKGSLVTLGCGVKGRLLGPFGKAGKCKVEFKSEALQCCSKLIKSIANLVI